MGGAARYEKFEGLLHLALEMQATRGGLSLEDIQERFGASRRTAMRKGIPAGGNPVLYLVRGLDIMSAVL